MADDGRKINIGSAYVSIIPSLQGARKTITAELTGVTEPAAKEAGEKTGKNFGEAMSKGLKATAAVITAAVAAATAGAVATGKAFINAAKDTAAFGDNIDKASKKLGISAKAYQEFDFIAQHSGTTMSAIQSALVKLEKSAGSKGAAAAFKELGLSQKKVSKMSAEDKLNTVITALQGVTDETKRSQLATALFSKSSKELGPLLATSAAETEKMRQQVHDLGGVMSDEAVKASADFQDQLQNMNTAMDGMKRNMMSQFLPSMSAVMTGIAKLFSGDSTGIGMISSGVQAIIGKLTAAAPQFLQVASSIIMSLIQGFGPMLPELTTALFGILTSAITTLTSMIPQMMPAIISGIQGVMSAVLTALPIIIDGITQLIMGIVTWLSSGDNVQTLVNGIIQMVAQIVNSFSMILPVLLPAIVTIISEVCKALTEESNVKLLIDAVLTLAGAIFVALVNCVPELIELVKGVIKNLGNLVASFFDWAVPLAADGIEAIVNTVKSWGNAIKTFVLNLINGIKTTVLNWINTLKTNFTNGFNAIRDGVSSIIDKIKGFVSDAITTLKDLPTKALQIGKDLIQGLINGIKSMATKAADTVKNIGKSVVSGLKGILGIHSPSRVFMELGELSAEGYLIGISSMMEDAEAEMKTDVEGLTTNMNATVSANGVSGSSIENNTTYNGGSITVNVYGAQGQDVNELAKLVAYKLEELTQRRAAAYA